MILLTAFVLGLAGSLHCAGMCGPLALALPASASSGMGRIIGPLFYNLGRLVTYGLLGLLFGLIGQSLALNGFQRWLSLGAGILILVGLFVSYHYPTGHGWTRYLTPLRAAIGRHLKNRRLTSMFAVGLLNGLLPCGLVYVACTGATSTAGLLPGMLYMVVFGLGTVPMMLGLTIAGSKLQMYVRFRLQKWIPVAVTCTALFLIVRGLALGIPYLSPDLANLDTAPCH